MIQQTLAKSQVLRSFPRVVLDGPEEFNGLGRKNLYFSQGQKHIEVLLRHGHLRSTTGKLLRTSLELHNLELGTGTSLLDTDFSQFHWNVTDSWLKHTWEYIMKHNIRIDISSPITPLRRMGDKFIMSSFFDAGYRGAQLASLNACRMFLQAATLADITSGDGTFILPDALHGRKSGLNSSPYNWPACGKPSTKEWAIWKEALAHTFLIGNKLQYGLGSWTDVKGQWFFSPDEIRIYHKNTHSWDVLLSSNPAPRSPNKSTLHPEGSMLISTIKHPTHHGLQIG